MPRRPIVTVLSAASLVMGATFTGVLGAAAPAVGDRPPAAPIVAVAAL